MDRTLLLGGAVLLTSIAATPALAQTGSAPDLGNREQESPRAVDAVNPGGAVVNPAPAGTADAQLGDVVVTARKRAQAEVLQATPLTATAFSGEQLAKSAAVNLADVGRQAPGVSFQGNNSKGQQNFNMRGVSISGSSSSDEPTVGVIQDGVYFGSKAGTLTELFDLESISVLRGPQGTLFGRNVTGGAVVVETKRPAFETSGRAALSYGNGDAKMASLVLNAPVVSDVIAARIGVLYRETDGLFNNPRYGRVGKEHVWLIRPSLLIKPSDRLDITIRGEYYSIAGDPVPTKGIYPQRVTNPVLTLPERAGYVMPRGYYTISGDRGFVSIKVYLGSIQFDWELGGGVLTSVTGVRYVDNVTDQDFDGTPTLGFRTQAWGHDEQFSSELRYAREFGDVLSLTAGVFFFHKAFRDQYNRSLGNLNAPVSITAADQRLKDQDSYAAFAEGDINITPQLTLTIGGRYTKEKKVAVTAPYNFCTLDLTNCRFNAVRQFKDSNFSPKIGLAYKITPDNLVYASATRAFRSGGYALSSVGPLISPYKSEQLTQYEIGMKNDFLDHRLRINASAYLSDYKDIQRTVLATDPVFGVNQSVFNAASAKIKGVELSVNAQVTDWLRLDSVYGYVHARYSDFLGVANPARLRFTRIPANNGSGSATVTHRFAGGGRLEATGVITFSGKYFYDDQNTTVQEAYNLIDATITYRPASERFTLSLYGKNLGGTQYEVWGSNLGIRGQNVFLGAPRTYGVRADISF